MLVEKGICHKIYRHAKGKKIYMKDYDKSKRSLHLEYLDLNNKYGWEMSQNVPVNHVEWIEDSFQFNEDFIKNYNEKREVYFFEVDVQYPEKSYELHNLK